MSTNENMTYSISTYPKEINI